MKKMCSPVLWLEFSSAVLLGTDKLLLNVGYRLLKEPYCHTRNRFILTNLVCPISGLTLLILLGYFCPKPLSLQYGVPCKRRSSVNSRGYDFPALKSSWDGTVQYWAVSWCCCNIDWSVTLFYAWMGNSWATVRHCWDKLIPQYCLV